MDPERAERRAAFTAHVVADVPARVQLYDAHRLASRKGRQAEPLARCTGHLRRAGELGWVRCYCVRFVCVAPPPRCDLQRPPLADLLASAAQCRALIARAAHARWALRGLLPAELLDLVTATCLYV